MNNAKIWSFSLVLSFLFHSSVFAFFLINKKPNENFLDGINAQIGEFAREPCEQPCRHHPTENESCISLTKVGGHQHLPPLKHQEYDNKD